MRTDYSPSAARWKLLRELGAHLAHGLMYGLAYLPQRHTPERARDIHTIVFVHGLAANRASFLPLQAYLRWRGFDRQYSYNYRSSGASIEALAVELKQRLDREVKGGQILLVAHSMGGLVSRAYLQLLGGDRRVSTLITLATPHQGSEATAWMPTRLVSQLDPRGPFLQHLADQEAPRGVRCLAYVASEDIMVLPPTNASWEHAEVRTLEGQGHIDMLLSPGLFREIGDELEDATSRGTVGALLDSV